MLRHLGARRGWAAKGTQVGQRILRNGGMAVECLEARLLLARDIYVDVGVPGPSHSGSSWANAYADLQLALGAAASGDRILVAHGVYRPTATTDRNISFQLKKDVRVLGGYAGYGAVDPNVRDLVLYPTILSGDIGVRNSSADNSYHVVTGGSGVSSTTILNGFTITAGTAVSSSSEIKFGGGMYLSNASPTLKNCTFSGNSATGCYGGGMYNDHSSPTLTNCTFSGNSAPNGRGGGMYNDSSSPTLTNCTFRGNSAAESTGGGMYSVFSSSPTLTNCTFSGNSGGSGGGMFNESSSSPSLTNCTFSGNSATSYGGGGMHNTSSSSPTLTNCVFSGNTASSGGGMYNFVSSSPKLTNCTFSGNTADSGGGMYNQLSSPTLTNCIVWGSGNSSICNSSSTPVITYSDIQGGYAGIGNINADPLFVRAPWTGPDGVFATADDDYGDLRLRVGSPALDVGSNAAVAAGITTDLAGNARILNGRADMGAYEGPVSAPAAKTLYVDLSAIGANTGKSWTDAFRSVQSALLVASEGDSIRVADGTYKPTTTIDRSIYFALRNGVGVYGGYAGYGAANPNARDVAAYPTVLSGDIGKPGDNTDNSCHVLTGNGLSFTTILDGFTVTTGYASWGDGSRTLGGGMYNYSSSPTLTNCTFSLDRAGDSGGGMYNCCSSSPTLINCTFSGNEASTSGSSRGSGGGMYNTFSSPILTNCTFTRNVAGNDSGGGMYNYSSSPALTNCTFSGNSAGNGGGGGMSNFRSSSPTLTHCTFSGNSAYGLGGGMGNWSSSSPTLTNCTFNANSASGGGGMDNGYSSSPTLTHCTFTGNSSSNYGAGMYNTTSSSPKLTNCIFSRNSVTSPSYGGGGMYNWSSSPTLINCTFSGNFAASGGGMYSESSSSPTLTNCIVWDSGRAPIYSSSSTPVISYSDIPGGYAGTGNINADPLFVRSPWTGPDCVFGTADDECDLRLRTGSPVLDVGSNLAIPAGVSTDLAGNVRIQNRMVDMGAYEGPNSTSPKVIYVDLAAAGNNTGVSWANAFRGLESALLAAGDGDTIRVAHGTYKPTTTTDRTLSFALRSAVAIYGAYAGYGAGDPDARDVALYPTILSGDIGTPGSNADNSYHVVTGSDITSSILDGFIITDGNANGSYAQSNDLGGGMYNTYSSSPTLSNCIFTGNLASNAGGGMYNSSSLPTLTNCTFSLNSSGSGGGMYNSFSSPTLTRCTFSGNVASYYGGGMYNAYSCSPTLINCTFSGNSVTGNMSNGGGMYNHGASPTLTNCTFSGNSGSYGGAMYNDNALPMLTNCTFSGNSTTSGYGDGMYNYYSSPALANCIVWGNGNSPIYSYSSTLAISYSDIQGGYAGTGNINADPKFVRNPSAGADGVWGTADDDYGDLRLQFNSPCIDAGDNRAAGLVGITTDLGGHARFVDVSMVPDTGFGTAPIVDMGAYEFDPPPTVLGLVVNDGLAQRSMVHKVVVTFSEAVTVSAGALSVVKSTGAVVPNVKVTALNPSGDQKTWELTFGGTGAVVGSLPDGIYKVVVSASGVSDLAGNHPVGDFSKAFHRLFGDVDGDRDVDAKDVALFRTALNRPGSYVWWMDYKGDGKVDNADYLWLRGRLLKPVLR